MRVAPVIFVFAMVLAVVSVPYAIGQTFTTITNVFTTTGLYTTNSTVGTTTETVVSENTFVSTTDTDAPGPGRGCYFDDWNITIGPGTAEVTGTIGPPSSKVDFFIMNQKQYYDFTHYARCGWDEAQSWGVQEGVFGVYDLTSTYSLDWKSPPAGWYYFIFSSQDVGLNHKTVYTPFVLVATLNEVQTSTIVNLVTNQATGLATSIQVTQAPTGPLSGSNASLIAGIIVVVLLVVAALYFVKSRRKGESGTRIWEEQKATVAQRRTDDKQFCSECGKPLPVGSKFCNKCGAAQQ